MRAPAIATLAMFLPALAWVDPVPLADYLAEMDRTPVSIDGLIAYRSGMDAGFTFYDDADQPFPVTIDAGRQRREEIEQGCLMQRVLFSRSDLCEIEALGTIEIRGSRIHISIDQVLSLTTRP